MLLVKENIDSHSDSYFTYFTGDGTDYLNVAIKDGCLSLTMGLANGKQEMQIKPNKVRFDDNQWHKVSVHRRIQEVSLTLKRCIPNKNINYYLILFNSKFSP